MGISFFYTRQESSTISKGKVKQGRPSTHVWGEFTRQSNATHKNIDYELFRAAPSRDTRKNAREGEKPRDTWKGGPLQKPAKNQFVEGFNL